MKVRELHELTARMMVTGNGDQEVRVGDQIESGPYLHASVGGVWEGKKGDLIICPNDDSQWQDESAELQDGEALGVLWKP